MDKSDGAAAKYAHQPSVQGVWASVYSNRIVPTLRTAEKHGNRQAGQRTAATYGIKENGRYKLDNRLLELSDRLKELRDKKGDLEYEVKQVNGEIENITTEMIGLMTTDELSSFNRNGVTFSLVTQEYPAPEPERKPELWAAMKEQGFEHLFTINAQTLQATVKELIAENDGVLPTWLEGLVKIAEKNSIRLTKSKK